jgi:hypothetical protein
LPIFFIFSQFWLFLVFFLAEKGQNREIVFCSIFFCWEVSTYQISENFIEQFWILPIFFIF